ncbi:MAG TPA: bifunctional 4-hydroxy-2-oxoglutarate aldolase/2-dehydro-3-deoxy-phosphogluconate aldolase [Vicinamibacterales bacterium]|nr:bifunctional 4-hydroxy-2-oxoglutarate aldolase/2-dehydro-3-deoxy-phosphogluconate aldolase [Vicinamibacterales bacterium]
MSAGDSTHVSRAAIARRVEEAGVVAVIRLQDPARLRSVIEALAAGGVRALEITMTVPRAIELIGDIAPSLGDDFLLGAGTVLDPDTARSAIEAGAAFVVSPVLRRDVIAECHQHDRPAMPGCFTPTEILDAWDSGADIVKVFPATSLGPGFFKDVRAPLPQVKLMPTGGVSIENAGEWIRAGAVAVGVGSALLDAKAIAAGDYGSITERARRLVTNVRAARASS